ncbi:efflux RND transporter permease subunit [Aliifodinibius sp. S!AR15-10]|uniref:efflux RND transporter permease subunit n=1 Tax=Aliifodinibius sp. S!AR15-10 TaxID=2950437 RepID=UPI00285F468A|nr:efflux RND transporter permease subunit [Aliifodinibius sp. S!AR15-10]MDR8393992.1 efflux RND transporter permease subunit [Aliifodinibius sp. S!AR15-10]
MRLPTQAIKNYQFVLIMVLLAVMVGTHSLLTMPRTEDPDLAFPNYTVTVIYPGTSPEDMEELVVNPLEDAIDELDDIVEVVSTIEEGLAVIQVEAEFGIDYDRKNDELNREINAIRDELPDNIFSLNVEQFKPEDRTKIIQLALVSETASYAKMDETEEDLQDVIESVAGVKEAEIEASPDEEIRVALDMERMVHQNISVDQVAYALTDQNMNIPGGDLSSGSRRFNIETSGSFKTLDQIRRIPVRGNQGKLVYLEDLAEVFYANEDLRWLARHEGTRAIFVTVKRKSGENLVQITEDIHKKLDQFRSELPPDILMEVAFEQAPAVSNRINGFFINLLQGIVLVGLVIFVFLGYRSSMITMTVIPIAMIIGIGVLDLLGFGLQQISIAALVIALGLLVDNGIVVIENIVRFRKKGYSFLEAAAKGTSEVGYAIISSTLTTVFAFAPLAMMQSGPGEFLRSLPVTVMIVLAISLVLALIFTPILAGRFLKDNPPKKPRRVESWISSSIERFYRPALKKVLRRKGWVVTAAILLFVGSGMLFPFIGVSFFPTADKPMLLIEVDTPDGANLYETDRAVRFVESVLDTTAFVEDYTANVGHGNPQVYYNRIPESYKKNHGQLLVNFREWDPPTFYATLDQFRESFERYPGAQITFRELKNGAPFNAPIEIRVLGKQLDMLKALSYRVEEIIRKTSGTVDVDNPLSINRTNLKVDINRDKASLAGLSVASIDRTVRAAMSGLEVEEVTMENGEEYPIVLRLPVEEQTSVRDFDKIYLASRDGAQVPLRQVAETRFESATNQILHYNMQRSTSVTANVTNPDNTTTITEEIIMGLNQVNWPDGYSYYVAGEYETQQEAFGDLTNLLILALVAIFAILVLQFRSFSQPLIIFSAIPLAITGSFIALFITGWSFSFFAFVGFISLMGIVVNNSIILVDYANQLRSEGRTVYEAIIESAETRFTPIVLTTTTTILGLLPLTLSNTSLWSPLGWTIIGGMLSSTALTLLIVPILYQWFTKVEEPVL